MNDLSPTPVATLRQAREIGIEAGLEYVYLGNVADADGEHTYCPGCKAVVIERRGFSGTVNHLRDGACADCGCKAAGLEM